ncbi:protein E10 [Elephant endotheliotropic herpesvirus 2]|nr:protein E10 [Elephant endotheliotropic herpesvirus 2]
MSCPGFLHNVSGKSITTVLLTMLALGVLTLLSRWQYTGKRKITVIDLVLCVYGIYFSVYRGKDYCGGYSRNAHCITVNDILNNMILMLSVLTVLVTCWMRFTEVPRNKRGAMIKYVRTLSRRWIPTLLAVFVRLDWNSFKTMDTSSDNISTYFVKEAVLMVLWLLMFFVVCDLIDKTGVVQVSGFCVYFYVTLFIFYLRNIDLTFHVRYGTLEYSRTCFMLPFVMYPLTRLFLLIR